MKDILFFDNMLTPKVITFVYWIMLVIIGLYGLGTMLGIIGGFSFGNFLMGIIFIVLGAIFARIWCELLIVLFKMNEALQDIRNKQA